MLPVTIGVPRTSQVPTKSMEILGNYCLYKRRNPEYVNAEINEMLSTDLGDVER